jgi:signal transduction histidine kinase
MKATTDYYRLISVLLLTAGAILLNFAANAQEKQMIQVKTFDAQLQPFKNAEISINGKEYLSVGSKGVAFIELNTSDLPVKSVNLKNEEYEAASWNLSKGTLEVVVRKKTYRIEKLTVVEPSGAPKANIKLVYKGRKTVSVMTNADGKADLPIAIDENITRESIHIAGYNVVDITNHSYGQRILVELLLTDADGISDDAKPVAKSSQYFSNFDLTKLDSIRSLTAFYAIFKNFPIKDLSAQAKRKVDAKFDQLMTQLQDSLARSTHFIGRISDSSFVQDDIRNLLGQAEVESSALTSQRADFDSKISLITEKLDQGIEKLDANTRNKLLADLTRLEGLLANNENQFYKNQNEYRNIITDLKERYFQFQDLENKLTRVEAERLEEQQLFRQRLIIISGLLILFVTLLLMLITFSNQLRKQKKQLVLANEEIKSINENLENIVLERTRLLADANQELDTFLYRASHDLRSPVRSIMGLCNLGEHLPQKELVQKVDNAIHGMDRLLQKLAMVSEINHPSDLSEIKVYDLLKSVEAKFQSVIRKSGVEFYIDCDKGLLYYSYPHVLEIIISNLLENSIFFASLRNSEFTRVELKAEISGEKLLISVHDNGIGIGEEIREKLYDMFYKGHERSSGNGLGLYIVQKSVQALNGEIVLQSEVGQYTTFTVKLPVVSDYVPAEVETEVAV